MNEDNRSEAAREARVRELAVLDWANTPSSTIREKWDCSFQTISKYREDPAYEETLQSLRREWSEEMLRLPQTSELKKKISHGMTLSLNALISILAGVSANKDKIAAARLMAQLDGRFLKVTEDGESMQGESIAQELLGVLKKQQVQ